MTTIGGMFFSFHFFHYFSSFFLSPSSPEEQNLLWVFLSQPRDSLPISEPTIRNWSSPCSSCKFPLSIPLFNQFFFLKFQYKTKGKLFIYESEFPAVGSFSTHSHVTLSKTIEWIMDCVNAWKNKFWAWSNWKGEW